ncbi:MAG TPA: rRNA maturation RNase YbeY [Candidatus Saccharimonadales bacterium]|nr:rRNA maturation RNase YbeY [Candidatus Saccharimonadales bacterium]
MDNINVLIYVESRYKVSRKKIKSAIKSVCEENNLTSPVEVSVAIVGDRKMKKLNKEYRDKEGTTNILSFPLAEGEQSKLPSDVTRLGDIIISYPMVIKEAARDEVLVDERVDELVRHGMLHLLGLHHE